VSTSAVKTYIRPACMYDCTFL